MKNLLICTLVILPFLAGCKKDKDEEIPQVTFTYKNMTTLIGKSMDYIKDASPGVSDEDNSEADFLIFSF